MTGAEREFAWRPGKAATLARAELINRINRINRMNGINPAVVRV